MTNQLLERKPKNLRQLKPYLETVRKINQLETTYTQLSDEELKNQTYKLKERLTDGETIHDIRIDAFATVREASRRVLGLRHFDVQLLGGLVLADGEIAEMKTGEGKTLVASLPAYLYALEEKGTHIITVNEYLARRDKEFIGQIHEFLGLEVGLNISGLGNGEKKAAYACDITYGVGTEFGFDYLRDNMVSNLQQKVQRPYHFAIIDEADSVLIDEARTPLIIAGKGQPSGRLYKVCASVVSSMREEEEYTVDPELKVVHFTDDGITKCEKMFGVENLFDLEHSTLFHALLQALRARVLYERDVDYIIDDGLIKLIDMNTGRVMEGRSLSDGLHQAIEAKEGLENTEENKTFASITIQDYYRMYSTLSGMTGTAKTEESELRDIYNLDVVPIPTNKPNIREDLPELVFQDKASKYAYLTKEVRRRHHSGQPILIGTISILQSEEVADIFDQEGLDYQILNAKSEEQEAELIAMAGQKGQITIATNMAGRGTDIVPGEGVAELGGLHVIGTERSDSERIVNQLKGRSGRQGDPGSTQFIISLEDYLFTRYVPDELERMKAKIKTDANGLITSPKMDKFVDTAQKVSEGMHYSVRERNLKLESVLNSQRQVVYEFRDHVLEADHILHFIDEQTSGLIEEMIDAYFNVELLPQDMDIQPLIDDLDKLMLDPVILEGENTFENKEEFKKFIKPFEQNHSEILRSLEENKTVTSSVYGLVLSSIDNNWTSHLDTMQQLKEGIGIRQYQQEDPIDLFEKEGYTLFESMFNHLLYDIRSRSVRFIQRKLADSEKTNSNQESEKG